MTSCPVSGAGLGLRRGLLPDLADMDDGAIDFMEVAPEGLSLSIGSPASLDYQFLKDVKSFLDLHGIDCYTEHLSYCSDDKGHLYDLMPMPFTDEAVTYVSARIREVQDVLERRIGIEHVSYYAAPGQVLSELEFINAVLREADCDLLLDVNNIYVNSVNFAYDPLAFLHGIDGDRTVYIHIAGHYVEAEDLRVDTHGSAVIEPVWQLLDAAYQRWGVRPTLLERDFNFPPMSELLEEVGRIRMAQAAPGLVSTG
jgi:uncharacterized protein (UPF0276 family)